MSARPSAAPGVLEASVEGDGGAAVVDRLLERRLLDDDRLLDEERLPD